MKAAIIGHGKMGREIEKILLERGHRIGAVIDEANASELDAAHIAGMFSFRYTNHVSRRLCGIGNSRFKIRYSYVLRLLQ